MPLTWQDPTDEEAQAMEAEGPIFSFTKDGVPTLSVASSQAQQPSTDSTSAPEASAPDSPTNPAS